MLWLVILTLAFLMSVLASLLDPQKVTQIHHSDFINYGVAHIDSICNHFSGFTEARLNKDWVDLKYVFVKDFITTTEVMQALASNVTLSSLYPSFSKLSSVALFLPVSTADYKQDFSMLK